MKSWCHFAVSQFATKLNKICLEYVPTEEDRSDKDVNNIAMLMTSERFQDWIAKTMVCICYFWIVGFGCELRCKLFFMRVFDRVVSDGKRRNA